MAIEDKYVNADVASGKLGEAYKTNGAGVVSVIGVINVAAADDDGSVYRVFPNLPSNFVPLDITISNSGITGGTDYELGLYETDGGDAVDIDCLLGSTSMASARAVGSSITGLSAVAVASEDNKLYELGGHNASTRKPAYDMALTANTVGTAAGTITIKATFLVA